MAFSPHPQYYQGADWSRQISTHAMTAKRTNKKRDGKARLCWGQ
jgi:hypothetical protein